MSLSVNMSVLSRMAMVTTSYARRGENRNMTFCPTILGDLRFARFRILPIMNCVVRLFRRTRSSLCVRGITILYRIRKIRFFIKITCRGGDLVVEIHTPTIGITFHTTDILQIFLFWFRRLESKIILSFFSKPIVVWTMRLDRPWLQHYSISSKLEMEFASYGNLILSFYQISDPPPGNRISFFVDSGSSSNRFPYQSRIKRYRLYVGHILYRHCTRTCWSRTRADPLSEPTTLFIFIIDIGLLRLNTCVKVDVYVIASINPRPSGFIIIIIYIVPFTV